MKHQALFSSKDKTKKIKVSSAAILRGALRVKYYLKNKKYDTFFLSCQAPSLAK